MFKIILLLLIIIVLIGAFFKFCVLTVPPDEAYVVERLGVPRHDVIERQQRTAVIKNDEAIEEGNDDNFDEDSDDVYENDASDKFEELEETEKTDKKINKTFPFKLKKPQGKKKEKKYFSSFSRLVIMIPKIDTIRKKVPLSDVPHNVIKVLATTTDNIDMIIDTYLVYRVFNPLLFTYEIEDFEDILEQFSENAVINRIGKMDMEEVIKSVDEINEDLARNLNKIMNTQKYGFRVVKFIVQKRIPPNSIKEAMEKKRKAELDGKAAETTAIYEKKVSALVNEKNIEKAEADAKKKRIEAEAKVYEEGLLISKYVENGLGELYVKGKMAEALANGNATVISGSEATFGLLNAVPQKEHKAIKAAVASELAGTEDN